MTATHGHAGRVAAWDAMRSRTASRLEDLEFLLSVGEGPADALARIGWTPSAAQRAAYRRGRHDLARAVGPALRIDRVSPGQRALRHGKRRANR